MVMAYDNARRRRGVMTFLLRVEIISENFARNLDWSARRKTSSHIWARTREAPCPQSTRLEDHFDAGSSDASGHRQIILEARLPWSANFPGVGEELKRGKRPLHAAVLILFGGSAGGRWR
jgi:hypothetical protein